MKWMLWESNPRFFFPLYLKAPPNMEDAFCQLNGPYAVLKQTFHHCNKKTFVTLWLGGDLLQQVSPVFLTSALKTTTLKLLIYLLLKTWTFDYVDTFLISMFCYGKLEPVIMLILFLQMRGNNTMHNKYELHCIKHHMQ
jgi:hypothetical protein